MEATIDVRIREWIHMIDRNWASLPGESKRFDIGRSIQFLTMYDFLKTLESRLPIVEQFSVLTELNTLLLKISNIRWLKKNLIPSATDHSGVGRILGVSFRS